VIDIIGSLLAKVGVCLYFNYYEQLGSTPFVKSGDRVTGNYSSLVFALTPLWISVSISAVFRIASGSLFNEPQTQARTNSRFHTLQNVAATGGPLIAFILLRGLQPLVIALQLDNVVRVNWSVVFAPIWMLTFSGIATAIIIIICAPYIHQRSPAALRESSYSLVFIFSIRILLFCTCSMIGVIYFIQRMDFEYHFQSGKNVSVLQVIIPVLILYSLLIVMHPVLSRAIERYDVSHH